MTVLFKPYVLLNRKLILKPQLRAGVPSNEERQRKIEDESRNYDLILHALGPNEKGAYSTHQRKGGWHDCCNCWLAAVRHIAASDKSQHGKSKDSQGKRPSNLFSKADKYDRKAGDRSEYQTNCNRSRENFEKRRAEQFQFTPAL